MSRQENDELRHELDNELDSIRDLLFTEDPSALLPLEAATLRNKPDVGLPQDTSQPGDPSSSRPSISGKDQAFDQYVRELAFDKRAKPKDRTKTEEELALDEKQRLEKAERRRLRRMQGLDDYDSEPEEVAGRTARARARGGDDLEDDFEDDETMGFGRGLVETPAEGEGTTDDDADGDGDEEEDEDSSEEGEENEEAGSEDEDEDEDGGIEDADLEAEEGEHEELISTTRPPRKVAPDTELPYTFECPDSHEAFLEIIDGIKDSDIPIVIQRIRTLHHPSLAEDNKFKLQVLGSVLIDHVLYAASPPSPNFGVVSSLLPHLAALSRTYPESSATHFLNKLKLMEKNLKHGLAQGALKPKSKTFPGLSELALLRSIGLIWSTSDMNHAVVTPARLLMAAYLGLGRVRSVQDLASGLFVCTLWLQYEDLSARFVPEAVNFAINAVLHLAPHKYDQAVNVPGNFPHPDLGSDLTQGLRISPGDVSSGTVASTVDLVAVLEDTVDAEAAKRQLLSTALNLIGRFSDKFQSLDGFPELFQPVLSVCKGLRSKKLPEQLKVCCRYASTA
jgi:nucleolar protein 14